MNKIQTLQLKPPLDENDLKAWQGVPLKVYMGFLEDLVDKSVIFNEEYKEIKRKQFQELIDLELSQQTKKAEESKVIKGRTRINAHPRDVQKELESVKDSDLFNSPGKDAKSSIAFKKTALASQDQTKEDNREFSVDLNSSVDPLNRTGGITLPSIFKNKKFEKELPYVELNFVEEDFLRANQNFLDLQKLKRRNADLFKQAQGNIKLNQTYNSGFSTVGHSKSGLAKSNRSQMNQTTGFPNAKNQRLSNTFRMSRTKQEKFRVANLSLLNQSLQEREIKRRAQKNLEMRRERSTLI